MTSEPDTRPQLDKFKDLARELECDEDEAAFRGKLRAIAQRRPRGDWQVIEQKNGEGFYARLNPAVYAPSENGPTFPTLKEAEAWASEQDRLAKSDK